MYTFKYKVGDVVCYKLPESPVQNWGIVLKAYEHPGRYISLSSDVETRTPVYDVITCINGEFVWSEMFVASEFERYSEKMSTDVMLDPIAAIKEITREKDKGADLLFELDELLKWTVDDLLFYPSVVWLEERDCSILLPTLICESSDDLITFTDRHGQFCYMTPDAYNKEWRAWKQWVLRITRMDTKWIPRDYSHMGEKDEGE